MFRSATFKLTMWYLAIVMAISLVFSAVLYNVATIELRHGIHRETERIYTEFPVFEGDPTLLRPTADYNAGAHRILLRLLGFNLIVLAGAGGASYWLARRTLEPIEEAHEQQKRFTADVSHELRTPLTAIRMESEVALLNNKASAAELRAALGSNLEEIDKLEALINNLLRLTRLEVEELQHSFKPISTRSLASAALKRVEALAANRKIQLTNKVMDTTIVGDLDNLTQLLVILLDNAIKYSPKKSAVIISSQADSGSVKLTVEDHGAGITKQALEHVFDRFYRADDSRQKAGDSGFGLGLSIAKMIADIHHGSITISSRVGQGTKAVVSIPKSASLDD